MLFRSLAHYPPNTNLFPTEDIIDIPTSADICAAMHKDIGTSTGLLISEPGLRLLRDGGEILKIDPEPGETAMVINTADLLEAMSNGFFPSGPHEVVCLTTDEKVERGYLTKAAGQIQKDCGRFAMPFFCHFKEEVSVKPLEQFITHDRPWDQEKYPDRTAGEALQERLDEIKVSAI